MLFISTFYINLKTSDIIKWNLFISKHISLFQLMEVILPLIRLVCYAVRKVISNTLLVKKEKNVLKHEKK